MTAKQRAGDGDPDRTGAIASDEITDTDKPEGPAATDTTANAEPAREDLPEDQQAL